MATKDKARSRARRRAPVVVAKPAPAPTHRVRKLVVDDLPRGELSRVQVELVGDGLGSDMLVPVLVARGTRPGPTFGITAAVHGNELNGIRAIHDLFSHIDLRTVRGSVVGVVAVNLPGLHNHQRHLIDGQDLNHIFPGSPTGSAAQVYAHRVLDRIVGQFDYLVDLHTASFGRINSLYVRADMTDPNCARMAYLQRPEIIVHNPPGDRTLRGAAMARHIPAITVEIGDPQRFQPSYIRSCRRGVRSILSDAGVLPRRQVAPGAEPVICQRSYWLYTDRGGLLEVLPQATDLVKSGDTVARLRNGFGDTIREYLAPEDGVVVGKSVNPVGPTGARILHLGLVAPADHGYLRREPLAPPPTKPER
jgi:predicted deacylase